MFTRLLAVALVAVVGLATVSEACKCLPLPLLAHCHTQFLAVVKITGKFGVAESEAQSAPRKHYTYELVTDLTSDPKHLNQLTHFKSISTALSSAACGVELELNHTYLLGGSFEESTGKPTISSCSAYVQNWPTTGMTVEGVRKECEAYRKAHP